MSTPWSDSDIDFVRRHYADRKTAWMAEQLGRPADAVYRQAAKMGLKKSRNFMASEASGRMQREDHRGRQFRFQKGDAPWNKGTHFVAGGRSVDTQFKKGRPASESRNYAPIGSLRITKDGILERKVTDDPSLYPARRWVAVHRLVWSAVHGEIPKGHIVVFKAGRKTIDPERITLDDVELITREENMRRNTRHNLPPEVNQCIQLRGALVRKINNRTKKREEAQA